MDSQSEQEPFKVLVFSKTAAYRHSSIPAGIAALQKLSEASKSNLTSPVPFNVDMSEDAALFAPSTLEQYRVIVLLQVSGDFLDDKQLEGLKDFVRRRHGGIVAIHCASFGMPSSEWYGRLIGAAFANHPEPQAGSITVVDPDHPILARGSEENAAARGDTWAWFDEWYNFKANPRDNEVHVLLNVDEGSYHGGTHGPDHPIAWCHEFEGGRSFYTALGHFDEAYQDEAFMAQVLNGLLWAARVIQ